MRLRGKFDDWLVIATIMMFLVAIIMIIVMIGGGDGRHLFSN